MKLPLPADKMTGILSIFSFGSKKEKQSFSEQAKEKLGLNGLEGEELLQALISAYKQGYIVDVYQAVLNEKVDYDSFHKLQSQVWTAVSRVPELNALKDPEQTVRALAHIAKCKTSTT